MIWRSLFRLLNADLKLHISRELMSKGSGPWQFRLRVSNLVTAGSLRLNARKAGIPVEDVVIGIQSSLSLQDGGHSAGSKRSERPEDACPELNLYTSFA